MCQPGSFYSSIFDNLVYPMSFIELYHFFFLFHFGFQWEQTLLFFSFQIISWIFNKLNNLEDQVRIQHPGLKTFLCAAICMLWHWPRQPNCLRWGSLDHHLELVCLLLVKVYLTNFKLAIFQGSLNYLDWFSTEISIKLWCLFHYNAVTLRKYMLPL